MNYWWSADPHFGHGNIIKYCGRTIFMSEEEKKTYTIGTVYFWESIGAAIGGLVFSFVLIHVIWSSSI